MGKILLWTPLFLPWAFSALYYTLRALVRWSMSNAIELNFKSVVKVKVKFSKMLYILMSLSKWGCFEMITISMMFSFKTVYPHPQWKNSNHPNSKQ